MDQPIKFYAASPIRSISDCHSRVFLNENRLAGHFLGTRHGSFGIPDELSHRLPIIGLFSYIVNRIWPRMGENAKTACLPLFDEWVTSQLHGKCHMFSSFGYAVKAFKKTKKNGGMNFLDAGNSHPTNFWEIISEEHARWGVKVDPYPRLWYRRGLESIKYTDWIFSPSTYVSKSFEDRGFPKDRILYLPYPTNLNQFFPDTKKTIPDDPLRIVCTGTVCFRKGFPYLLEAVRIIASKRKVILMLTQDVHHSISNFLLKYKDLNIEWSPRLSHDKLGSHLKSAHVFALLSLEDGFALTAAEALACGIPVVLTPNTGFADFIKPGINGEIVPIRDSFAAADAIIACYERAISGHNFITSELREALSFANFNNSLVQHLFTVDHFMD